MKFDPKLLAILLMPGIFVALPLPLAGQDSPASQIKIEISRLQRSIQDKPISDPDLKELASSIGETLKSAASAVDAGQLYLGLEKLGQAEDLLQGARAAANREKVEKGGLRHSNRSGGK